MSLKSWTRPALILAALGLPMTAGCTGRTENGIEKTGPGGVAGGSNVSGETPPPPAGGTGSSGAGASGK